MAEERAAAETESRYARYPEGVERLLQELTFPVEDENMKKLLLQTLISSLLHY